MEDFVLHMVANPMLYIGYLFSAAGAAGILLFFMGFFGGIGHLFTYSESVEHMEHSRTRALWGVYLCMVSFGLWELLQLILGNAPGSSLILIIILLSPAWIPWVKALITGSSGGH